MSRSLALEAIGDEGVSLITTLTEGETVVGREPEHGIAIDFGAISREHGKFLRVRNHWFYQDLGSTNGSWLNGDPLAPMEWRLVRSNDYLQLADRAVRLRESDDSSAGALEMGFQRGAGRSLIVFTNGEFRDEFPIPEFGRALVVGGAQADLEIRGDLFENPGLVVERRSQGVCAYSVESQQAATINGREIAKTEELKDRDVLKIREHLIIFNDPPVLSTSGFGAGFASSAGPSNTGLKSWGVESADPGGGSSPMHADPLFEAQQSAAPPGASPLGGGAPKRPTLSSQFGRVPDEAEIGHDETIAIDSSQYYDQFRGSDHHPSARYSYEDTSEYSFSSTEDRITIMVGVFLLILLFVLVIWWVFLV
ncbi:MAG: FHA domain-containing protein [Bdellovibrionales bacterium]|nr:FHA domain-containing protein [Bdellovibrionales bacterium]